ncbi:MAG: hypothetical protein JWN75_432 [Candidatus Saccharibacteria bacterium]|nr:hypothetical protein [Candidatus Saccharibacteria bacterium]
MIPLEIASTHFANGRVMQLGTLQKDGQPRVNTVYYVASSDNRAVYWMSEPGRRHSVDSLNDMRVAGAIAVKTDHPVMGLQFTGAASEVTNSDEVQTVANQYTEKYGSFTADFFERFQAGTNKHHLYKMMITNLELFDEVNFPGGKPVVVPLN